MRRSAPAPHELVVAVLRIHELYEPRDRPELKIGNYTEQAMQPAKEGTPV